MKAKLAWLYMLDECDNAGVWRPDFDLASFQLDFKITLEDVQNWFGDKIFLFEGKVLVVPFFEFQYGTGKDGWSAKVAASNKLYAYGFTIENNQTKVPTDTTVPPQYPHSGGSVLSKGKGKGKGEGGVGETKKPDLEVLYQLYPKRGSLDNGKRVGLDRLSKLLSTGAIDHESAKRAIENYASACRKYDLPREKIKMFSTFFGEGEAWREYAEKKSVTFSAEAHEQAIKEARGY